MIPVPHQPPESPPLIQKSSGAIHQMEDPDNTRRVDDSLGLMFCWISLLSLSISFSSSSDYLFTIDETVLELTDANFESAISTFDCVFIDFYEHERLQSQKLSGYVERLRNR